ncbi:proline-rich antigen [Pyrenophora seminiperda CCB06]|uniref:Proline-rich antigen n=1 Tax=Pyrenophora seminiperda CCB06 TaxID=1302712 RepID=A0A3M7MB74_9PLEO|nr:proline-rich antigen [Pyrenophora seminiperda CCB06]
MRFQATALAVAASMALVSAQDLSAVPQCAVPCFAEALPSSGCSVTDVKCQCTTGRQPLTDALMKCVPSKCSPQELANLTPALAGLCAQAGVTLSNIPSGSMPTATASGAMSSGHASASGSASATKSGAPQQTKNAAAGMGVEYGALALGIAAVFGL